MALLARLTMSLLHFGVRLDCPMVARCSADFWLADFAAFDVFRLAGRTTFLPVLWLRPERTFVAI